MRIQRIEEIGGISLVVAQEYILIRVLGYIGGMKVRKL